MFRKYRTNFTIKSIKENINKNKLRYNNEYYKENNILKNRKKNEHKRKKKLPIFSKSLSKINNNQNNYEESNINNNNNNNNININNSNNEYINNRNISYDKELKDSFFSLNEIKNRNSSSYCKYDKNKLFKLDIERRNPSLAIIKEANDNFNIEPKDSYKYRKQSAKIVYDINKSKKKNKLRENTPKEKNIYSSEKYINNYRPKNSLIKNKQNLNKNNFFNNDEYFNSLKNKSSIDDYIISIDLGIGSYAEVKLGTHKITKKNMQLKYMIKI